MPPKRKNPDDTGHGAIAGVAPKRKKSIDEKPQEKSSGLKNSLHGITFQLKLLVLFFIRGITVDYKFKLGTEIPGMGGKFDDLIFKYEIKKQQNDVAKTQKVRYLQAKHKQNEETEKITSADLLSDNNGEFSLPKYFRSYRNDVINGSNKCLPENIQDCIICTNIGFEDEMKLKEKGIELLRLNDKDDILTFAKVSSKTKSPTRYKLKKTEELSKEMTKWSDIYLLAKTLFLECVGTDTIKLTQNLAIFKTYQFALVEEKFIDWEKGEKKEEKEKKEKVKTGKLCATFLEGDSHFRRILSDVTFDYYVKKFKFICDDKKKSRINRSSKKLTDFDGKLLTDFLTKHPKTTELDIWIFQDIYDDLIKENIINATEGRTANKCFTSNFIRGINLSREGLEFRDKLRNIIFIHYWKDLTVKRSKEFGENKPISGSDKSLNESIDVNEIDGFLDKLVFAVHTPNEVELDGILKEEISQYYSLNDTVFQSDFILRNMLDWFKKKESTFMEWQKGISILQEAKDHIKSLRMTADSIHYQKELKKSGYEFNPDATQVMSHKLKQLLLSENKIETITALLPKRTAVKVIAALRGLRLNIPHDISAVAREETFFQRKDSYLMASSVQLNDKYEKFKKTFNSDITSHHLLIAICEAGDSTKAEKYYEKLVKKTRKKVIIIRRPNMGEEIKDDVKFIHFSDHFKEILLGKEIKFQGLCQKVSDLIKRGSDQTVDKLIECGETEEKNLEEIFNLESIEELIEQEISQIQIPSFSSSRFEKSLYIKRQLTSAFPLDDGFWKEVAKQLGDDYSPEQLHRECRISQKGEIEWIAPIVPDKEKAIIWEKINSVLAGRTPNNITEEDTLIDPHEKENFPEILIISGVAGAGKSSILSHYYEAIKEKNQDHWVIIINFTDHSKDFLNLLYSNEVNLSNTIECLVNLSAVVGASRFGRSMLRRRLEIGDRITIFFDGFDEIVISQYQETAIRVMKVLRESKSAGLYVTTRSHMASQLQFQLSQLNHNLKNFSKKDQTNYLTSLWKRNIMENYDENNLRRFTESLVDRISKTLKDGERAFIGIPLQCRILAECFETDIQKFLHNKSELASLLESIERLNLNLANLYRLLVTKKRTIYEQEKKALSRRDDLADSHAQESIDNLEPFLRKLAIKTIVSLKEHVNVLLGNESTMKSKGEQIKENEKREDHCTRFGLLDKNAQGKVQFLHRTYAEFLMAEHLYNGFLLDDEKRNQLLDCESARKLIIDQILVKEQYDGVQLFFDSMLKEIVDKNDEWESIKKEGHLPERFHKLSEDLYRQFCRQNQKPAIKNPSNVLRVSVLKQNEQIFNFFCDCLDATFDKSTVIKAMAISFVSNTCEFGYYFTFKLFRHQHSIFHKIISYYNEAHNQQNNINDLHFFKRKLIEGMLASDFNDYSYWRGTEKQQIIDDLLDFMLANQKKSIDPIVDSHDELYMKPMLSMFIFSEHYDRSLLKFLTILSDSKFYFEGNQLSNLLKNVFHSVKRKNRVKGRIGKVMSILQTLGRQDVLNQIYGLVLTTELDAVQNMHNPSNWYEILQQTMDLSSLLERDLYRMTPVHRAAFHGDTAAIDNIQTTVKEILTNGADPELIEKAKKVVKIMSHDDKIGFTPFYLAAACGHEKVYVNMLTFLKDIDPGTEIQLFEKFQTYLTDPNGFVYHSLSDAMESENLKTFKIILNVIKTVLGQNCLLHLLKSKSRENKGKIKLDHYPSYCWPTTVFGVASCYEELFHNLAEIVIRDGTNENYQDLDDLVFYFLKTEDFYRFTLKHINEKILQGMFALKCSNDWTKRLLDAQLVNGFELLSKRLVKNFQKDQLKQLIKMIIVKDETGESLWSKITNHYEIMDDDVSLFFKYVLEKLDKDSVSSVIELVIRDDGDVQIPSRKLINCMFVHLSGKNEEERYLMNDWKKYAISKINQIFFDPASENVYLGIKRKFMEEYVWFYLKNGSDAQLSNFVQVVTSLNAIEENKKFNLWKYVLVHDNETKETTREILKNDHNATKMLLLHKIDEVPLILKIATSWKKYDDALLPEILINLPNILQEEMKQYLKEHAPKFIDQAFLNLPSLNPYGHSYSRLNTLISILNYGNKNQLQLFFEKITSLHDSSHTMKKISIWGDLFRSESEEDDIKMMDKFLRCVSEILGTLGISNTTKNLILHADEDKDAVIFHLASRGEEQMIETMLNHLNAEDRKEVQLKVDRYLHEKFKTPPRRPL